VVASPSGSWARRGCFLLKGSLGALIGFSFRPPTGEKSQDEFIRAISGFGAIASDGLRHEVTKDQEKEGNENGENRNRFLRHTRTPASQLQTVVSAVGTINFRNTANLIIPRRAAELSLLSFTTLMVIVRKWPHAPAPWVPCEGE
jgi:hypothetical protein